MLLETYRTIRDLPRELRDAYKTVESVVKHVRDFMNPNHPHSVVGAIAKIAGGGALGLGAVGLGALGAFGPEIEKEIKELLEGGLSKLDDAIADAAKRGREELEKKLAEILTPNRPTGPDGEPVPMVPWSGLKDQTWLPQGNPDIFGPNPGGGKVQDLNKRLEQVHPRIGTSTQDQVTRIYLVLIQEEEKFKT
jgi:hypothetical protein